MWSSSPDQAGSVPARRNTVYCSGVSSCFHSSSGFVTAKTVSFSLSDLRVNIVKPYSSPQLQPVRPQRYFTGAPASGRHRVSGAAHEEEEIIGVELPADVLVGVAEGSLEALQRLAAALDVRVVGREHHEVGPGLGYDPPHVLCRVWGEAHLAVHEVA